MSATQTVTQTVEETPVVAPPIDTPATEPVTEPPIESGAPAAGTSEAPAEQPKEESAKEDITPATDGLLGYKGPGIVKGLRFVKRYFYFSDDAVESKQLAGYLSNEKALIAHPIAAWANQTGKGLLFYSKRAEDKASPTGIFNLAEISEVAKEGSNEFAFKINGQKHAFQASNSTERVSWVTAIEAKAAEAKEQKETITSSDVYKSELEKLGKPAVVAVEATPKKSVEKVKESTKEEATPATEDKVNGKSRSQSRKRASIFGNILGKRDAEEKKEGKEETTEDATAAEPAAEAAATEPPVEESIDDVDEEKKPETPVQKSKRASIFNTLFHKVASPGHEKAEKDANAPTTVSSTAPQLENPVDESASKPIEPESVTQPTEAAKEAVLTSETTTPPSKNIFSYIKDITKQEEKKAEDKLDKEEAQATTDASAFKEKRRPSLFGSLSTKKEKKSEGVDGEVAEGEAKPKSNKLGGLFRRPSRAVKAGEPKKDKEPAGETEPVPEEDKPEPISKDIPISEEKPIENGDTSGDRAAEAVAEPINVTSTATPVQAAA